MGKGVWAVAAGIAVLSAGAIRNYTSEAAFQAALAGIAGEKPANHLYETVEKALEWAPEHGRARSLRGQSFFSLAEKAASEERRVLLQMAVHDLKPAFAANPADGAVLLSLSLASAGLQDTGPALGLLYEAASRRPGYAEHAWLLARALPAGSAEQKQAYQLVTKLRPTAAPQVIAEIAKYVPESHLADYVAPTPAAYRAWAWGVSDATRGIDIALWGLQYAKLPRDKHDAGWLEYYIGLKTSEREPDASLPWFRKAIAHLPGEHAIHRNFGFALLKSGQVKNARTQFNKSIALEGDVANAAYLGLAQAEEALGGTVRAKQIYKRLEANPRLESWVRLEAGTALQRLSKP